jgi:lipid A 3-O-deacylase
MLAWAVALEARGAMVEARGQLTTHPRTRVVMLLLAVMATSAAAAADLPVVVPPLAPAWNAYEFRLGGFYHAAPFIGPGHEAGGADLNAEFLTPRLPFWQDSALAFLSPRLQAGAMLNFGRKTSYAYAGFAWTVPVTEKWFLEPMFGGAIHNGELNLPGLDPDRLSLGCRQLFHTGLSGGYHLGDGWSVMLTWEHLSNAGLCVRNQGINDVGAKIGFSF